MCSTKPTSLAILFFFSVLDVTLKTKSTGSYYLVVFLSALDRALIRHVLNFVCVKNLQTAPVDSFYGPLSIKADKMYSYIF